MAEVRQQNLVLDDEWPLIKVMAGRIGETEMTLRGWIKRYPKELPTEDSIVGMKVHSESVLKFKHQRDKAKRERAETAIVAPAKKKATPSDGSTGNNKRSA